MLTLNYIIWRRDVAARKLVAYRSKWNRRVWSQRARRREGRLEQRVERWARLMLVQQHRLGLHQD